MGKIPKRLSIPLAFSIAGVTWIVGWVLALVGVYRCFEVATSQEAHGGLDLNSTWIVPMIVAALGWGMVIGSLSVMSTTWQFKVASTKAPSRRGWYRDAASNSEWRYWDGSAWATEPEALVVTLQDEVV